MGGGGEKPDQTNQTRHTCVVTPGAAANLRAFENAIDWSPVCLGIENESERETARARERESALERVRMRARVSERETARKKKEK